MEIATHTAVIGDEGRRFADAASRSGLEAVVPACPDWDVREMYLHVLGTCEAGASMRENVHQRRRARKHRSQQASDDDYLRRLSE